MWSICLYANIFTIYIYINEIYKYIISPKKCKAYPPFRMLFPPFLWPTPNWPQPMSPRNNQQPQHLRRSRRGSVVDPHVGHWVWAAKLEKRLFFVFSTTWDRRACCFLQRENFEFSNLKPQCYNWTPCTLSRDPADPTGGSICTI